MTKISDYFASKPTSEFGKCVWTKVEDDRATNSQVSALRVSQERSMLYYFGQDLSGQAASAIGRGGEQGELAVYRVNQVRALVQTLKNLILSARVVWECVAANSDYASEAQTIVGEAILEQYWKDFFVAKYAARALEEAIVFGEGFVYAPWDVSRGDAVQPTPDFTGVVKTGDLNFRNLSSWNVIRDAFKRSWDELDWVIVELRENRFNLAARYPAFASKILETASDLKFRTSTNSGAISLRDTDDISVYHFYHKRTPALPDGRESVFVSGDCVMEDGKLSYPIVPLFRVAAGDLFSTPFGYSSFEEMLGPQELFDSLASIVASNQTTFGAQMIAAPMGSEVSPENFGGMKLVFFPPGGSPPQALQLTKTPPEIFSHMDRLVTWMEQILGLNGAVRGQANSGEQSGSALALLSDQAKQQSSGLQGSFYEMLRALGQGILETIRVKCPFPRKVALAGQTNQSLVQVEQYTSQDLTAIHRVNVDIGNPLQQTIAGRQEIFNMYVKALGPGKLLPEQIEQVIETGRLENPTSGLRKQLLLILSENESIRRGESPPVLADDDHAMHMREHVGESANPEVRQNPQAMAALDQHMSTHWELYRTADPARLIVLGQQPPPMMGPPPPDGPPPGANPPKPPGIPGPPGPGPKPPPVERPINKETGERTQPPGPPLQA